MGLGPSRPSVQELSILKSQVDACTHEIAEAIRRADVLLLCAGAGFSADSGLAVYEDIAGVKAYQELGYKYHNVCRPEWLSHDPEIFYGFWGTCFNDYRKTQPHDGYAIIRKWRDARFASTSRVARSIRMAIQERQASQKASASSASAPGPAYEVDGAAGAFYVFTSNVDGHSFDYFEPEEVRECHGNTEVWQCGSMPPCCKQTWRAAEKFKFAVDMKKMRAPAKRSSVTKGMEKPNEVAEGNSTPRLGSVKLPFGLRRNPLQNLPKEARKEAAAHVASSFGRKDNNWPCCPFCNGPARPRVLMFNDSHWVSDFEQESRFQQWREVLVDVGRSLNVSHGRMMRLLILEIGCGGRVPTVRSTCESTALQLKSAADVTVARINPDFPLPDRLYPPSMYLRYLALPLGALEGLKKVNEHYMQMTGRGRNEAAHQGGQKAPKAPTPAAKTVARSRSPKRSKEEKAEQKEPAKDEVKKEEEEKKEALKEEVKEEEASTEPVRRGAAKAKAKAKARAKRKTNSSRRSGRLSPNRDKQPERTPPAPRSASRAQTKKAPKAARPPA